MTSELREKLAFLAEKLQESVSYTLNIHSGTHTESWPSQSEQHRLYSSKFETVFRVTLKQVMELEPCDFIKKDGKE